jgi:hypothetical protein
MLSCRRRAIPRQPRAVSTFKDYYAKNSIKIAALRRQEYIASRPSTYFGTEIDESPASSPFIFPDSITTALGVAPSSLNREDYFVLRSSVIASKGDTFKKGAREYLNGRLYCQTHTPDVLTIKAIDLDEGGLLIHVGLADKFGHPKKGTLKQKNKFQLRVARVHDPPLLASIVGLGDVTFLRCRKGNARVSDDIVGHMWALGSRPDGTKNVGYVTSSERDKESQYGLTQLLPVQACLKNTERLLVSWLRDGSGHAHWKSVLNRLRAPERKAGIYPDASMGGKHAVTASCMLSYDLGNESHYDVNDMGSCVSVFAEKRPGRATNWYLCFPNMKVQHGGVTYYGLRIELCHGAIVEWDGRVMKHFTSVTSLGTSNHVYGCFHVPCRRLVDAAARKILLRDPKSLA